MRSLFSKQAIPTAQPVLAHELVLIARHPGIMNYIAARSNYRCHVWCGPMHAFEQGKLVIFPNTLLFFSLGCLAGINLSMDKERYSERLFLNHPLIINQTYKDVLAGSALFKEACDFKMAPDAADSFCNGDDLYCDPYFCSGNKSIRQEPWCSPDVGDMAVFPCSSADTFFRKNMVYHLSASFFR